MIITFDIETIPTQSPEVIALIAADIKAPGQMKKAETIAEWEATAKADAVNDAVAKTSFDGAYGQICCIGWALDDGAVQTVTGDEKHIINTFFADIKANYKPSVQMNPVFVGHNVSAFDLRFLFQRAIINQIKPPAMIPFNAKSWDASIFDTMTYFAGFGNKISLDKLAKALGLDGKGTFTGADVWPLFQAGKIADIARYCEADVELTRQVYKRLTFAQMAA